MTTYQSSVPGITEKNIENLIPQNENLSEIYVSSAGIERTSSYGHYKMFINMTINGRLATFKKTTTSSMLFDEYKDTDSGTGEREELDFSIFEDVVSANIDNIIDFLKEDKEND